MNRLGVGAGKLWGVRVAHRVDALSTSPEFGLGSMRRGSRSALTNPCSGFRIIGGQS